MRAFNLPLRHNLYWVLWGIFLLFLPNQLSAQEKSNQIPKPIQKMLLTSKIPDSSLSFSIQRLTPHTGLSQLGWQANQAMHPASVMKILTTLAALDLIGPQYRWKTNLYTTGYIEHGTLKGNLYWQGFGDPKLVPEELANMMLELRRLGIHSIAGDLVLDRSAYHPSVKDSAPDDGEPKRAYNVAPDPLLYAFQTISFTISQTNSKPVIQYTPRLTGLKIVNQLESVTGDCSNWSKSFKNTIQKTAPLQFTALFSGNIPSACSQIAWNTVALEPDTFFKHGVMAAWKDAGGQWKSPPNIVLEKVPKHAQLLISYRGTTLSDAVKDINKLSNNVMARHLYLTLAVEKGLLPASTADSFQIVQEWLKKNQLPMPELVIENGSGLSNIERISAEHLSQLLTKAVKSPTADYFIHSLPIAGIDGTMKHRLSDRLKKVFSSTKSNDKVFTPDPSMPVKLQQPGVLMKTGSLSQVRSIAGYVISKSGQVYALTSIINHPMAPSGGPVHDALLTWLLEDGLNDLK